jgi:RNA polymerase sigma factor (sigma-70 family)
VDRRTDSEVMAASLEEPQEFGAIYRRYFEQVYRYLARRAGHSAADDLAAEVFVRAFTARSRFDLGAASARPWLYGFASNVLRDHLRSQQRRTRAYIHAAEPAGTDAGLPDAMERANAALMAPRLQSALAALPEADRETFLLHVLGELTYGEVALTLHIPIGTVRSRIARARSRLRELTADHRQTKGGGSR